MSIFTRAFNKAGGYDRLASQFPGGTEPQGPRWDRTCVQFARTVRYDWCVTIIVTRDGLWVQAKPPMQGTQAAILVPWAEIREARQTTFYWRRAAKLTCGTPEVGTITVWQAVWDAAGPLWQAYWDQQTRR